MADFEREIIITNDGSHSLSVPGMNEQYHSVHGAKQEAEHVFFKMGLDSLSQSNIRVLEIGFGTGLNALLSYNYARDKNISMDYVSLEKYPVLEKEYLLLNYGKYTESNELFLALHQCAWGINQEISRFFNLTKLMLDLKSDAVPDGFDIVFFDAFAPNKQPEMWSVAIFEKMHRALKKGGILVTYCCQGQAKRNMIAAGFKIEKVPGPPGKREMLRALKSE